MKKAFLCLVLITVLLCGGCGAQQVLPEDWEEDWTVVCPTLAVEPFEGFTLYESNDALYLSGIYYATWVAGEARPHTNEEGEEAEVFDAQIYVILQEYRNSDSAAAGISQWTAREKQTFEAGEEYAAICADQEFTILPLLRGSGSNPYSHGAAAFAVRGNWAICVEFLGAEGYATDMEKTLEAFLCGFHFGE